MRSVRPSRMAEATASLFVKSCKPSPSLGAIGSIQGADSHFRATFAIHASGQPSFLVRRKSAILCGRALFPPNVLYFPQLYSLFSLIGCSGIDKPTQCGVWRLE